MSADAEDLWRFAVALHARSGVETACLALQDEAGVDVPLLLFAAWAASHRGATVDRSLLEALDQRIGPWRESVIRPLRTVRRTMKSSQPPHRDLDKAAAELRSRIKTVELEAERLSLDALALHAKLPPGQTGTRASVLAALRAAVELAGAGLSESWRDRHLATIAEAVPSTEDSPSL
ncbi:MAG: TIGR02444 family protein [Rhodospirillum sp.]|nr:TIGR02444 family protein [Rhodospirillum sp.]MCF8491227.1 TIGR02444 family protein [Rhodospirillum sp.]MCF8500867.1 TIGR02444 family protein [Rhodospirillum sp.]